MNESMLTGESIPVVKVKLPNSQLKYDPEKEGKSSTLFAGTLCIQLRPDGGPVIGMVS